MFEHDHSAARGEMSTCKLVIFKHDFALGNAPSRSLFDLVSVKKKDKTKPAHDFSDYEIAVDKDGLSAGVKVDVRP